MSIKVSVLASGSRGNATFVRTERARVLIDCGLGPRTLAHRLRSIGESPDRIDALLVTHEHTDHIAGLGAALKTFRLEAYMSQGTIDGSGADQLEAHGSAVVPVAAGSSFRVGDLDVDTVAVPHDAREPMAFSLRYNGIKVTQLTDLGWIPDSVADLMRGSHILILESNHDLDMLRMGSYPWSLKQRLVGRNGHLSNAAVGRFLQGTFDGQAVHVVLAHLSSKNNHPEIARQEACQALAVKGCHATSLSLATQDAASVPIELG